MDEIFNCKNFIIWQIGINVCFLLYTEEKVETDETDGDMYVSSTLSAVRNMTIIPFVGTYLCIKLLSVHLPTLYHFG